jgi:hypothetical protein
MYHGDFPQDPREQNALWYRLYKAHKTIPPIWEAHKTYLLTRDMTTIAAVFAVVFSIGLLAVSLNRTILLLYVGALVAQYVFVASAARNYGNRFVLDVVSEESSSL